MNHDAPQRSGSLELLQRRIRLRDRRQLRFLLVGVALRQSLQVILFPLEPVHQFQMRFISNSRTSLRGAARSVRIGLGVKPLQRISNELSRSPGSIP